MIDQQINENLNLLEKELSRLKEVTDYIDDVKHKSNDFVLELEKIQQNYAIYTENLFSLYKQHTEKLSQDTEAQINENVLKFETTSQKIETLHKENTDQYKSLLDQYKNKIETYTDEIKRNTEIKINEGVLNFETTGNKIDATNREKLIEIQRLLERYKAIVEVTDQLIKNIKAIDFPEKFLKMEKQQSEQKELLLDYLSKQNKKIKNFQTILYITCGLVIAGITAIFLWR